MSSTNSSRPTVAVRLAAAIVRSTPERDPLALPGARRLLMDVAGICIAARQEDYVLAALAAGDVLRAGGLRCAWASPRGARAG